MARKPSSTAGGTGLTTRPQLDVSENARQNLTLAEGGNPFPPDGMVWDLLSRVVQLETHFGYVRKDVDDFKESQRDLQRTVSEIRDDLHDGLRDLPTKRDLSNWQIQWILIGISAVAVVVLGIIGGLAWLKPESASPPPQPVIIQVPTSPAAPVTPTITPSPAKPQK